MAESLHEQMASLQARLDGLAQGQITAWHVEQQTMLQTEQARFAEIDREVSAATVDTDTVMTRYYEGLEALRYAREEREYERSPAYADYLREQRETDRAIGRMERREERVLEATMTPEHYALWRDGTPDERQALRETLQTTLTQDVQDQGLHGRLAVLTPEEDTAFSITVPFVALDIEAAPAIDSWEAAIADGRMELSGGEPPDPIIVDTTDAVSNQSWQELWHALEARLATLEAQPPQREPEQGMGY